MKLSRKRRTPIEHTVSEHTRKGKVIAPFQRGKGKRASKTVRSRVKKTVQKPSGDPIGVEGSYRVRLWYVSHSNEKFDLESTNFQEAQKSGFGMSSNVEHPIKVSVRMK